MNADSQMRPCTLIFSENWNDIKVDGFTIGKNVTDEELWELRKTYFLYDILRNDTPGMYSIGNLTLNPLTNKRLKISEKFLLPGKRWFCTNKPLEVQIGLQVFGDIKEVRILWKNEK